MMIENKLTQEALSALNEQYLYCVSSKNRTDSAIQNAYYEGMKTMLNLILTDNYKSDGCIAYSNAIKSHIFVQVDRTENYSGDNEINIYVEI